MLSPINKNREKRKKDKRKMYETKGRAAIEMSIVIEMKRRMRRKETEEREEEGEEEKGKEEKV